MLNLLKTPFPGYFFQFQLLLFLQLLFKELFGVAHVLLDVLVHLLLCDVHVLLLFQHWFQSRLVLLLLLFQDLLLLFELIEEKLEVVDTAFQVCYGVQHYLPVLLLSYYLVCLQIFCNHELFCNFISLFLLQKLHHSSDQFVFFEGVHVAFIAQLFVELCQILDAFLLYYFMLGQGKRVALFVLHYFCCVYFFYKVAVHFSDVALQCYFFLELMGTVHAFKHAHILCFMFQLIYLPLKTLHFFQ